MHHDATVIPKHEDAIVARWRSYAVELMGAEWARTRETDAARDKARAEMVALKERLRGGS